jgi:hypothetical protein
MARDGNTFRALDSTGAAAQPAGVSVDGGYKNDSAGQDVTPRKLLAFNAQCRGESHFDNLSLLPGLPGSERL